MAPRASAAARTARPAPVAAPIDPSGEFPKMLYGPKGTEQLVKHADEQAKYETRGFVENPEDVPVDDDEDEDDADTATAVDRDHDGTADGMGAVPKRPRTRKKR